MEKLTDETQLANILSCVKKLNNTGIGSIGVDRNGTLISTGISLASDLLDLFAQENNERTIILLSDGADWKDTEKDKEAEKRSFSEVALTSGDPVVLSDSLHNNSGIRIHTIAISNKTNFERHCPGRSNEVGSVPNVELLIKMAEVSDGMFLETPVPID